jgi:hypothetical protein
MKVAILLMAPLLCSLPLIGGCATYEFDLTRPEQFATHIGRKQDVRVTIDPLEYRFRTLENRLVVRIFNPTNDAIELSGSQSSAVDPKGESHPLRGQTIVPGTFVKLILPPMRPTVYDPGPHFGFGFGIVGRAGNPFHDPFYGPFGSGFYDEPRYYTVYDDDNYYWNWPGESTARLLLTFRRGEQSFRHQFTFARKKV